MSDLIPKSVLLKDKPIKVVSYIRESTADQTMMGYRPEVQRDNIERYCERHNFEIVREFEDSGSGGDTIKRPQFLAMIDFVKNKDIKFIVIDATDRFFRNVRQTLHFEEDLEENHGIFAIDTRIDYHPRDYLDGCMSPQQWSTRMQARVRAEEERKIIQQRVKEGYTKKAKLGLYVGEVAYGLMWKDEHHKFIGYKENEAKIVKEIFKLYMTGNFGYTELARHLNKLGYIREVIERQKVIVAESKVYKRLSKKMPFTNDIIRSILRNKSYIGVQNTKPNLQLITIDEFQSQRLLPPLINVDDFNYVQQLISENRKGAPSTRTNKTSRQKSTFLLQGIAHSGINGCKLHGQTEKTTVRRYIASTNKSGTDDRIPSLNADDVESKIIEFLEKLQINDKEVIEAKLREVIRIEATASKSKEVNSNQEELNNLKKALKALQECQQYNYTYQNELTIRELEKRMNKAEISGKSVKTSEEMKYYDLIELRAILNDIAYEFGRLQDLSAKEGLVKVLFSEFFIGQAPTTDDAIKDFVAKHKDSKKIGEAKDLKALLQRFVPSLFEKIYVEQVKDVVNISFQPTGLFLLLADKEPVTTKTVVEEESPSSEFKKKGF